MVRQTVRYVGLKKGRGIAAHRGNKFSVQGDSGASKPPSRDEGRKSKSPHPTEGAAMKSNDRSDVRSFKSNDRSESRSIKSNDRSEGRSLNSYVRSEGRSIKSNDQSEGRSMLSNNRSEGRSMKSNDPSEVLSSKNNDRSEGRSIKSNDRSGGRSYKSNDLSESRMSKSSRQLRLPSREDEVSAGKENYSEPKSDTLSAKAVVRRRLGLKAGQRQRSTAYGQHQTSQDFADKREVIEERSTNTEEREGIHPLASTYRALMKKSLVPEEELNKCIMELALQANKNFLSRQYDLAMRDFDRTLNLASQKSKNPSAYGELLADIMLRKGAIYQSMKKNAEALDEYCVALELYQLRRNEIMTGMIVDHSKSTARGSLHDIYDQMNKKISIALVNMGDVELKMKHYDIAADIFESCHRLLRHLWNREIKEDANKRSKEPWFLSNIISMLNKIEIVQILRGNHVAAVQAKGESQRLENKFTNLERKTMQSASRYNNPYSLYFDEDFDPDETIYRLLYLVSHDRVEEGSSQTQLNTAAEAENIAAVETEDLMDIADEGMGKREATHVPYTRISGGDETDAQKKKRRKSAEKVESSERTFEPDRLGSRSSERNGLEQNETYDSDDTEMQETVQHGNSFFQYTNNFFSSLGQCYFG